MKNQTDQKMQFATTSLAAFKSVTEAEVQAILSNCSTKLVMQKSGTDSQGNSPGQNKAN